MGIKAQILASFVFVVAHIALEANESGLRLAAHTAAILASSSRLAGLLLNLNHAVQFSIAFRDKWDIVSIWNTNCELDGDTIGSVSAETVLSQL